MLIAVRTYGRKLDNLFCDEKGRPTSTKIGVVLAGGAWTYYMIANRPDSVEMWLAFYVAVAATDLLKKLINVWFAAKAGVQIEEETSVRANKAVVTTSKTTTTPAANPTEGAE
jgi:hypothetical protein